MATSSAALGQATNQAEPCDTVAYLPRENGAIPEKRCPVHNDTMAVERLRICYGLPAVYLPHWLRRVAALYREARATQFPETRRWVGGGCSMDATSPVFAEVYFCSRCREAEDTWLKEHAERESGASTP